MGVVATAGLSGTVVKPWDLSLTTLWGVGWNGAEVGLKVVVKEEEVSVANDGEVEVTGDVVVEEEEDPDDVVRELPEPRGLNDVLFMLNVVPF